jgi:hypothetical protein
MKSVFRIYEQLTLNVNNTEHITYRWADLYYTDVNNGYDLIRITNQFTSKEVALETLQELIELKKKKEFWVNLSGTYIIIEEYEI